MRFSESYSHFIRNGPVRVFNKIWGRAEEDISEPERTINGKETIRHTREKHCILCDQCEDDHLHDNHPGRGSRTEEIT